MSRIIPFLYLLGCLTARSSETWTDALARMPLPANTTTLNRTNCAEVLLGSFQSNATVKALLVMPGATDELYFFRRAQAVVTNQNPSVLDAVVALTNQTHIRAVFRPPFLLLHSGEDLLDLDITVKHPGTLEKLQSRPTVPHWIFFDRDWDALRAAIKGHIGPIIWPGPFSKDSRHFYRHTFAAWNLTGWETLEAVAYTSRATITVRHGSVVFDTDMRVGQLPKLEHFP